MPEFSLNTTANSGRSCYGVSLNIVPDREVEFADLLARANSALVPLPWNNPDARLSAMANPAVAAAIDAEIEDGLKQGGAVDVSAKYRTGKRLVEVDGLTYLLPTTILCDSRNHPLAGKEYMFPFSAVVRQSNEDALAQLGSTLSLAVYTQDEGLKTRARNSTARLVSVNKPTSELDRRQPHEGNVFELGFERRSYVE